MQALQYIVNPFSDAAKNFGLTISLKKTEVLYQPPPREAYSPPHISIDGINLNASPHISIDGINLNTVEHLAYQGSVMSNDATVSKNLDTRLSKASSFFGRLSKRVWLEAFALLLRENPGTQNRRHSHPPLPEADQATWAGSSTLLSLHPWHGVARLRVRRRSPQESQLAQHRFHLASGAAALGWARLKDGRRTRAQTSLLQRAPKRKA